MDTLYTGTAYFLGLVVAGFAAVLLSTIIINTLMGKRYRAALAQKLGLLRLGKMLTALGIDKNQYLHRQHTVDIKQHMMRCSQCENTSECDDHLKAATITTENIGYCNNEASLKEMALDEMAESRSQHARKSGNGSG